MATPKFNPLDYGATPVTDFDPTKLGATSVPERPKVVKESGTKGFFEGAAKITGGGQITKAIAEMSGGGESSESLVNSVNQLIAQSKTLPLGSSRRTQLLRQAQNIARQATEQTDQRLEDLPTEKEVAADAIQLGTTVGALGVGPSGAKSVLGRVAQTGGKLGGLSAISGGAEAFGQGGGAEDIAKSAALSGAVGGALGAGGQAISELAQYLTSPAVSEGLYNRALGLTKKTVEKGKSPSKMLLAEGIGGSKKGILAQTNKISDESRKSVEAILEGSKRSHTSKNIVAQIEKELQDKFQNTLGADDIKTLVDKLPLNKLRTTTKIDDKTLNALRQELDTNFLGNAKWLGESTAEKTLGLKTASNVMRTIVQSADDRLPPIFERWSKAITASRSLRSELAKPHALSNMLELLFSLTVGGATGGLTIEGLKNSLITFGAINAGQSAPVKTGVARGMQSLGRAGAGTVSKTATGALRTAIPGITKELTK